MLPDLVHAALAFLADTLESESHPYGPLARRVLDCAGRPTEAGVQLLHDLVLADTN